MKGGGRTVRYVLPTRPGKVSITCAASSGSAPSMLALCERTAATLELRSAAQRAARPRWPRPSIAGAWRPAGCGSTAPSAAQARRGRPPGRARSRPPRRSPTRVRARGPQVRDAARRRAASWPRRARPPPPTARWRRPRPATHRSRWARRAVATCADAEAQLDRRDRRGLARGVPHRPVRRGVRGRRAAPPALRGAARRARRPGARSPRRVKERLRGRGVAFGGAADGVFALDPVPRVLTAEEWSELQLGVAQRLKALDAFVADVYGDAPRAGGGRGAASGGRELAALRAAHARSARVALDLVRGPRRGPLRRRSLPRDRGPGAHGVRPRLRGRRARDAARPAAGRSAVPRPRRSRTASWRSRCGTRRRCPSRAWRC